MAEKLLKWLRFRWFLNQANRSDFSKILKNFWAVEKNSARGKLRKTFAKSSKIFVPYTVFGTKQNRNGHMIILGRKLCSATPRVIVALAVANGSCGCRSILGINVSQGSSLEILRTWTLGTPWDTLVPGILLATHELYIFCHVLIRGREAPPL